MGSDAERTLAEFGDRVDMTIPSVADDSGAWLPLVDIGHSQIGVVVKHTRLSTAHYGQSAYMVPHGRSGNTVEAPPICSLTDYSKVISELRFVNCN